jgi:hypothetical protein
LREIAFLLSPEALFPEAKPREIVGVDVDDDIFENSKGMINANTVHSLENIPYIYVKDVKINILLKCTTRHFRLVDQIILPPRF